TLALTGFSPLWRIYLQLRGVKVGSSFTCIGRPGMNLKRGSSIRLGSGVTLCNSGMANPVAEQGRCRLATVAAGAEIHLHDNVGLSSCLICCATHVEIGSGTIIGGGAMIMDTDFHPRMPDGTWGNEPIAVSKPVSIGKKCFIGARAIILKGVTIGDGAVIGAGAVVSQDVPEAAIVAGNPACIVRSRSRDDA
ncbi:MAG: acyltransferase, partial [Verrucomicrobia bacterium]|nr:acyltransferase [Verrucomicrobiota bacterium]